MAKKYKNLQELAAAFASGEIDKTKYTLVLDNDDSFLRYSGPLPEGVDDDTADADAYRDRQCDEAREWFRGRGYSDLQDACLAAGIPAEWC